MWGNFFELYSYIVCVRILCGFQLLFLFLKWMALAYLLKTLNKKIKIKSVVFAIG